MLSRPMLNRIAFLGISWYAILIVAAIGIGIALSLTRGRKFGISSDTILNFCLLAIPLGIVFARLYYVFFRWSDYSEDLFSIVKIHEGGLAIYGGILGGLLAAHLTAKREKVNLGDLLDCLAPSLVLGQAIGRWGNYINMEAYGLRVNEPELQFFPFAVEVPVGSVWYWQMATFFYEFCWDLLVFLILWFIIQHHRKESGDVFRWYVLLYCSGRAVIEGLRSDSLTFISDFVRISQIFSGLFALVIVVLFFLRIRDSFSPVILMPVITSVLAFVETALGEFERNAYSDLFPVCQAGLIILLAACVITLILWTLDCGHFDVKCLLALMPNMLFIIAIFAFGMGRANEDNTYYVTFRQSAAMLQVIISGYLLCYRFCPGNVARVRPVRDKRVIHE